jgi:hypothetical protein
MRAGRPLQSDLRHPAAIAAALLVALVAALATAGAPEGIARSRRVDSRLILDPLGAMGVVRVAPLQEAPLPARPSLRDALAGASTDPCLDSNPRRHGGTRLLRGLPSDAACATFATLPPPRT